MAANLPASRSDQASCRRILSSPQDEEHLSQLMCLTRAQIEIFAANSDDIAARATRGGTKQHFEVGRVGIRCIHCAHLPIDQRAKGAVSYPISIRVVNQAVRNWQRYHFGKCDKIPADVKERYSGLQGSGKHSKKSSKEYWKENCKGMGLIDTDAENGVRFGPREDAVDAVGRNIPTRSHQAVHSKVVTSVVDPADALVEDMKAVFAALLDDDTSSSNPSTSASSRVSSEPAGTLEAECLHDLDFFTEQAHLFNTDELENGRASRRSSAVATMEVFRELDLDSPERARPSHPDLHRTMPTGSISAATAGAATATKESSSLEEQRSASVVHRRDDLIESVGLALGLAKRVREDHDRGVQHFSSRDACGSIVSDDQIQEDLVNLGRALSELFAGADTVGTCTGSADFIEEVTTEVMADPSQLFAGIEPFFDGITGVGETAADIEECFPCLDNKASPTKKKKKGQRPTTNEDVLLRDLGYPGSLCILISALMDAKDNGAVDRYDTAQDVEEDLRLLVSDPERYLCDADSGNQTGRLVFPESKLYGRGPHIVKLMDALNHVIRCDGVREMVLVSGYSGTGKSVLVEQICKPLSESNGYFISGKFDGLGQVQPMAVIFAAFDEYCNLLLKGKDDTLVRMSQEIKGALGSNGYFLTDLIPNLKRVIGESKQSYSIQVKGKEAMNRLAYYFKMFVRAIASHSQPVVLFFDDLQWADDASLNLISMLVSDTETPSLLFIGSYRDNEIDNDHPLNAAIGSIEQAGLNNLTIKLENIDCKSVNELVSDTLHLLPRLTQSLGDIVYAKTSGNPLFVIQFLRSLYDENLLLYSAGSRRWEWNVETIEAKDIADNVVDLMKTKISGLRSGTHRLLKVAACLGSQCDASTLQLLKSDGGSSIMPFLDVAVREGLMSRTGSCYKFSHDRIQEAAYSLIPENERDAWHLRIGMLLWKRASGKELDNNIFLIVDQLYRGSTLITDHDEKVKVSKLLLMAGERAMSLSNFLPASRYFLQGCSLLGERDWEHQYDLCLQLFTCCAEAQCVLGSYEGVASATDAVFAHGRSLQDKLSSYYTQLHSLGTQGKPLDAIKNGLDVLAQLGESFTNDPSKVDVLKDFAKTKAMVEVTTFEGILQKNDMENTRMVAIMKVLQVSSRYAYQVNQPLMSQMVSRMVQLSLCHGICRETPYAVSLFGLILCMRGELEKGSQYGKLALSLLNRCKAEVHLPLVYTAVHGLINIFSSPMQANLPLLRLGHEVGMSMGDTEGASTASANYVMGAFQSGNQLGSLAEEVKTYSQEMKEHKHQLLWVVLPYYQAILNLMGNSEDPSDLTGDAMNQDEVLSIAFEKHLLHVTNKIYLLRMWLAYLFRKYDVAAEMAERLRETRKARPFRIDSIVSEAFYTGLTAVAMERGGGAGEWRSVALEAVEKMTTWAANSSWNFQNKLCLLNAEIAHLDGDLDEAAKKYNDAIRVAGKHGFVHEQALACELAGMFHSKTSSAEIAAEHFERARMLYLEWGAKRKADDVGRRLIGEQTHADM